ncbi:hypothetical protein PR048_003462 [Dryococelus australis]|uniref:Uncharacterized protein n=1 Tax=Dryococelus australis TaxID=614101 RepID=A0ABQ9INN0_9NEOP|nr:hypothetical protein PR048_003462 [Dryococelus australis]
MCDPGGRGCFADPLSCLVHSGRGMADVTAVLQDGHCLLPSCFFRRLIGAIGWALRFVDNKVIIDVDDRPKFPRNLSYFSENIGFDPWPDRYLIFASGNRAGRCRWSAFFLGDISRFPPPQHSDAAPFSPHFTSSDLETSLLRAAQRQRKICWHELWVAAQQIDGTPCVMEHVYRNMTRRYGVCNDVGGRHIEPLLNSLSLRWGLRSSSSLDVDGVSGSGGDGGGSILVVSVGEVAGDDAAVAADAGTSGAAGLLRDLLRRFFRMRLPTPEPGIGGRTSAAPPGVLKATADPAHLPPLCCTQAHRRNGQYGLQLNNHSGREEEEGMGSNRPWPLLGTRPSIRLERFRKTMGNLNLTGNRTRVLPECESRRPCTRRLEVVAATEEAYNVCRRDTPLCFRSPSLTKDDTTHLPPRRTGFDSRRGPSRMFTFVNRAGRCRWSAGFLEVLSSPPHNPCIPFFHPTHFLIQPLNFEFHVHFEVHDVCDEFFVLGDGDARGGGRHDDRRLVAGLDRGAVEGFCFPGGGRGGRGGRRRGATGNRGAVLQLDDLVDGHARHRRRHLLRLGEHLVAGADAVGRVDDGARRRHGGGLGAVAQRRCAGEGGGRRRRQHAAVAGRVEAAAAEQAPPLGGADGGGAVTLVGDGDQGAARGAVAVLALRHARHLGRRCDAREGLLAVVAALLHVDGWRRRRRRLLGQRAVPPELGEDLAHQVVLRLVQLRLVLPPLRQLLLPTTHPWRAQIVAYSPDITTACSACRAGFPRWSEYSPSHLDEPGSIPGGADSGFSHVGIVPDGAAGFLGDLPFTSPLQARAAPSSPHCTIIDSRDLEVKIRPNFSTPLCVERSIKRLGCVA